MTVDFEAGKSTVKTVPFPGVESTLMRPPIDCSRPSTAVSPRPLASREAFLVKKESKTPGGDLRCHSLSRIPECQPDMTGRPGFNVRQ